MTQEHQPYDPGQQFCARCGSSLDPGARFCGSCGAATDGGTSRNASQSVDPTDGGFPQPEYMGFWIRLAAIFIDWILILILVAVLSRIFGSSGFVVAYVFWLLYLILFTAMQGQTLGKMFMGIQVVDAQGNIPSLGKVLLREIVGRFVSGLLLYLGYAWVAWDQNKRGWHDHIAGTFVVRKGRERVY